MHALPNTTTLCCASVPSPWASSGSQATTNIHLAEQETCGGVRLDVRYADGLSLDLNENTAVASEAASLSTDAISSARKYYGESGAATGGRVEKSITGAHGSGTSPACNAPYNDRIDVQTPVKGHLDAKDDTVRTWSQGEPTKDRRPLQVDTLPESRGPRRVDKECHHPQDEGCRRCQPVIFSLDLTHSEVDALVGPAVRWKDPFQVRD